MRNLMKGSRCEKRDSTDGLSAEEGFGPPAAIPFKWEEAPGKAKPKQEGEMDGELIFDQFICKGDSMENSAGSVYRSVDGGPIPLIEAGNPRNPAPDEGFVPLNLPPVLQSPERIASPVKGSGSPVKASTCTRRWASLNLRKLMSHNQRHKASGDSYSRSITTQISVCQELGGASKSSRISELPASFDRARSSHGRLEFISEITSSSYSSQTESGRIDVSRRGSGWSLETRNSNKSYNLQNPNPTEHHISDEPNAANKGADLAEKSRAVNDKKSASEEEEPLDFHHVIAEILNSEAVKEEIKSDLNNGDKKEEVNVQRTTETNMELEIMMRFAQINVRKKKGMKKMTAYETSDATQRRGFFGCLPVCLLGGPRQAKIYEDCLDSMNSHCNAVSKSNHDLDRGF